MRPDLHTLTGAYAVDALPVDERPHFESHLHECEACRREVAELQATACDLAVLIEQVPPPGLRASVLAEIDRTRQAPPRDKSSTTQVAPSPTPVVDADARPWKAPTTYGGDDTRGAVGGARPDHRPDDARPDHRPDDADELARRRSRPWWVTVLAPAAAVVLIAVLGLALVPLLTGSGPGQPGSGEASPDALEILAAPDADTVAVEGPDGSYARVVLSAARGEAIFVAGGMDPAPHEHTYELWLIDDERSSPAGVFDVDDTGRVAHTLAGDLEQAVAIGVTIEPEGGSPQPTTEPVMLIDLDDA